MTPAHSTIQTYAERPHKTCRTAARIQSKAKVTRAHFGKQRLIQRNIGRYEPKAQFTAISLAHATAKPAQPASPSTNPSTSSAELTGSSNATKAFHPSPPCHEDVRKRKLDLFRALDEGNRESFSWFELPPCGHMVTVDNAWRANLLLKRLHLRSNANDY